jgi:hypothetical protein
MVPLARIYKHGCIPIIDSLIPSPPDLPVGQIYRNRRPLALACHFRSSFIHDAVLNIRRRSGTEVWSPETFVYSSKC